MSDKEDLKTMSSNSRAVTDPPEEGKREAPAFKADTGLCRTIFEQSPMGISVSADGITLYANRACIRMFGYDTPEEIIGTSQLNRIAPSERWRIHLYIKKRKRGESAPNRYEVTGLRKDGTTFPLYVEVTRIDVEGEPYSVGFFTDFTDKKQVEETLLKSEKLYRLLVESIDEYIAEADTRGICTYASPRVYDLIGYAPEEVVGKSPFDFMEPAEAERVTNLFKQRMQKREAFDAMEHSLVHRNGTRVIAEVTGKPFFDDKGNLLGYRTISRDITKHKQADEALAQTEKKYRNIFENAVEGIFQTLPDGRFLDVNPAMARIFGYDSPQDLIEAIQDIGRQVYLEPATRAKLLDSLAEKGYGRFEIQTRRKDGSIGWIHMNTRVVRGSQGEILCYEGFAKDITDRKHLEEKLREANAELETRVRERTEDLNSKSAKLEEMNITLRTILEQREGDRKKIESEIIENYTDLVKPHLEKLKAAFPGGNLRNTLDMLDSSLTEILSPLIHRLNRTQLGLSQTELNVANLIRKGMQSKEIAELLKLSKGTVDCYRNRIREKLGIRNRKLSLRDYLLSLTNLD